MNAQRTFLDDLIAHPAHPDVLSHYAVEAIRLTLTEVSERREEFTADDVKEALPIGTRASLAVSPQVLGACFKSAALANEIEDTGRMARTRSENGRKRRVVIWRRKR